MRRQAESSVSRLRATSATPVGLALAKRELLGPAVVAGGRQRRALDAHLGARRARGPGRATNTTGSEPPPSGDLGLDARLEVAERLEPRRSEPRVLARAPRPRAAGRPGCAGPPSSAGSAPRSSTAATVRDGARAHVVDHDLAPRRAARGSRARSRRDGPGRAAALSISSAPASRLSLEAPPSRTIARTWRTSRAASCAPRSLEARARAGRRPEHEAHARRAPGRRSRRARRSRASSRASTRRRRIASRAASAFSLM